MSLFEKNLSLLCERAPEVGWRVKTSAVESEQPQLEPVAVGDLDVHYIFGLGAAPKSWRGHLVLLEHDVARWKGWLSTPEASALLENPKVMPAYFDPDNPDDPLFDHLYSYFSTLKVEVLTSAEYGKKYPELATYLRLRITQESASSCRLVDEYKALCDRFYQNFYVNLQRLPQAVWGAKLFGQFEGVPAIICGAGPSLDRNLEVLAGLRDKALIFAGGSALNAVSCNGVLPHFGAGVDPHHHQFQRLMTNQAFETPMFFRSRWFEGSLPIIQGTPLYLNGSGGQLLPSFAEAQLGIPGPVLDEGFNVVNFTVEIARALGCNPILFVGMDLAYTGEAQYAQRVLHDVSVDPDRLFSPDHYYDVAFERPNVDGEAVHTHWKWLAEARWIGDFAKRHPDLTLLNCTEGGIGFPGVENVPLAEAAKQHLRRSWPLQERLHSEIRGASAHEIEHDRIESLLESLQISLERCEGHLKELDAEFVAMGERVEELPPTLRSGRAALLEVELESEPAHQAILSVFSYVFQSQMNRELAECDEAGRLALERERIAHLREATALNLRILNRCR